MTSFSNVSRRGFLQGSAALLASRPLWSVGADNAAKPADDLSRRLYKTLKFGMAQIPGTLVEKFTAVKAAGFDGIELNSPGNNVEEVRKAIAASGLFVDGSVCTSHWQVRHTDPDAAVRAKALGDLQAAIRETHAVGGHTVLLVIGHGKDGKEEEIWKRSSDNIRLAIPLAAELGVNIAIENVWNEFLYDHGGGHDQTAEKFVKYVDELNSPWVGMQFDIGNHWKYGNTAEWIRALGRRIVKLDVKGFSRAKDKFADIGEDDIPWGDIRQALVDINFHGWVAAEVGGGNAQRLRKVATQMEQVFKLKLTA